MKTNQTAVWNIFVCTIWVSVIIRGVNHLIRHLINTESKLKQIVVYCPLLASIDINLCVNCDMVACNECYFAMWKQILFVYRVDQEIKSVMSHASVLKIQHNTIRLEQPHDARNDIWQFDVQAIIDRNH